MWKLFIQEYFSVNTEVQQNYFTDPKLSVETQNQINTYVLRNNLNSLYKKQVYLPILIQKLLCISNI